MEPKVIVMIVMLTMPGGDNTVHVKPFPTVATCIEAANVEVTDPFVRNAECAELDDGVLMLRFEHEKTPKAGAEDPAAKAAG
jgi:hypothetical protein